MKLKYLKTFFSLACFFASFAKAYDLVPPVFMETAQTLPKGVRSPIYYNMAINVRNKWNNFGESEPIDLQMNRPILWKDMLSEIKDPHQKELLKSLFHDLNIDPNDGGGPGSMNGALQIQLNTQVPVLGIGISDDWMLTLAIPVIQATISADSGFVKNSDGQRWMDKACSESIEQCNFAANQLNYPLESRLADYKYEKIQSKTFTALGDIVLMGRYLIKKNEEDLWTLRNTLVLPTGKAPNPDALIDIPMGDGRFQVGSALLYDRTFKYDFRLNVFGGMMFLLPNQMDRRIPESSISPLSPDKESLVRNFNYLMTGGLSLQKKLFFGLVGGAGYHYQYLTATTYSHNNLYSQERYHLLEQLSPAQELHSAVFSLGLSTVDWFLEKKFFYPFQAHFIFSTPLAGKNVVKANIIAAQLIMFF